MTLATRPTPELQPTGCGVERLAGEIEHKEAAVIATENYGMTGSGMKIASGRPRKKETDKNNDCRYSLRFLRGPRT